MLQATTTPMVAQTRSVGNMATKGAKGWRPRVITTSYYTRKGVRRRIRLYEAWLNLRGRIRGGKTMKPKYWAGRDQEFLDWHHFRTWALENGYRKGMDLDRIDSTKGYSPDNCQWLTKLEHRRKSNSKHNVATCACNSCKGLRKPKVIHEEAPF